MGMIVYEHPYIYKLNSTDKETQIFKKKVNVKATILGTCMCCTVLHSGEIRNVRLVTP